MFMKELEQEMNVGFTDNGARSNNSTLDKVVDLFGTIGAMRNVPENEKRLAFRKAYAEDKELTLKVLFYARDCRGGLGERSTFKILFDELINIDKKTAMLNLIHVPTFGRWDDMINIMFNTSDKEIFLLGARIIDKQLQEDYISENNISLLGKWMPSLTGKRKAQAKQLINILGFNQKGYKATISELRTKLKIVEKLMSQKRFNEIDYSKVPSYAMKKYRGAFKVRDTERFEQYLGALSKGEVKVNAATLFPYDIVRMYLQGNSLEYMQYYSRGSAGIDQVAEAQWKALPNYIDKPMRMLVCADTSSSMSGLPMEVATSLAIYASERNACSEFKDKFITFDSKARLIDLSGCNTLKSKLQQMKALYGSTNVADVFLTVLKAAVNGKVPQDQMPEKIVIISDMQFDYFHTDARTLMDGIREKFEAAGYTLPQMVWWNADADRIGAKFPMTIKDNCVFVSGASAAIFKSVLMDAVLTPLDVVRGTVETERYSILEVSEKN